MMRSPKAHARVQRIRSCIDFGCEFLKILLYFVLKSHVFLQLKGHLNAVVFIELLVKSVKAEPDQDISKCSFCVRLVKLHRSFP